MSNLEVSQATDQPAPSPTLKDREEEHLANRRRQIEEARPSLRDQARLEWIELESGIPIKFQRSATFLSFQQALQPKAYAAAQRAADHYTDANAPSLVLLSPNLYGVGKTHLLSAIVKRVIELAEPTAIIHPMTLVSIDCPVLMTTETSLMARIRDTYHKDACETESQVFEEFEGKRLLLLDDVGKVRPRDPSFLQSMYSRLIDGCYNDCKPVVIATNLNFTELEAHIGGAPADRLREMCGKEGFVVMKGKSFRR